MIEYGPEMRGRGLGGGGGDEGNMLDDYLNRHDIVGWDRKARG